MKENKKIGIQEVHFGVDSFISQLVPDFTQPKKFWLDSRILINSFGHKEIEALHDLSSTLQEPLSHYSKNKIVSEVSNELTILKLKIEQILRINYEPTWFQKIYYFILGLSPIDQFSKKLDNEKLKINKTLVSLGAKKSLLKHDNRVFEEKLKQYQQSLNKLIQKIQILVSSIEKMHKIIELEENIERKIYLEDKILIPLQQRILEQRETLIVMEQGIRSLEFLVQNNNILIKGIEHVENITLTSLNISTTLTAHRLDQKELNTLKENITKTLMLLDKM